MSKALKSLTKMKVNCFFYIIFNLPVRLFINYDERLRPQGGFALEGVVYKKPDFNRIFSNQA